MNVSQALPQIVQRASQMEKRNLSARQDDKTLTVPPVEEHRQTFILLHGRGDHADWFGGGLLDSRIPEHENLHNAFPNAKFIFPQAQVGICARQRGWRLTQWFDMWGYETQDPEQEGVQIEGLRDTTSMLHELIITEADSVGAENIVIGGLSNGCAASMIAFLTWNKEPLGGYLGMCGHLPLNLPMRDLVIAASEAKADTEGAIEVVKWLRNKLELPAERVSEAVFQKTPAFIGHGGEDTVVPTKYGRRAAELLKSMGARSIYREYQGLTHWYSDIMLGDFINYLKSQSRQGPANIEPYNKDGK